MLIPVLVVAVTAQAGAAPPVKRPPAERRWAIHAGGGLALAGRAFSSSTTFTEFAEEGSISTRSASTAGPQMEAGVWRALSRRLGVALTGTYNRRDAPGTFSAAFPHPLYLDRHRLADGPLPGAQRETNVHLGLVWSVTRSGITARLTGGPSYVLAEADLVEQVAHDDEYPFDAVRVTAVRTSPARGDALGGHGGLTLERGLGQRVALGVGARWSRATIDLARRATPAAGVGDGSARVTAGGVTAAASLRFSF